MRTLARRSVEAIDAELPPDLERREIVDGVRVLLTGADASHGQVQQRVGGLMEQWSSEHGGIVLASPYDLRLGIYDVRQPDVVFVRPEHAHRVQRRQMTEPPDIVVEVLSPSTREADLVSKRRQYAELGVPEYWCLDADAQEVFVFRPPSADPVVLGIGETLTSPQLPGFVVPVERLLSRLVA